MVLRSKVPLIGRRCRIAGGSDCCWLRVEPLACAVPLAICCEGRIGACNAEMAEDAVAPEVAELTACGLAVVIPVAGSAFPGGQSPLVGFFRTAQLPDSPDVMLVPFVCAEDAEMVDVEEFVEASDEDEFCRWAVLRPEANIFVPSSLFMAARPFSSAAPHDVFGWNDKGGATAVIRGDGASFIVVAARVLLSRSCRRLCPKGQSLYPLQRLASYSRSAGHRACDNGVGMRVSARCEVPSNGNGHGSRVVSADGPWGVCGRCCGRRLRWSILVRKTGGRNRAARYCRRCRTECTVGVGVGAG